MQPLKFVSEIKTIFLEQVFLDWSRNTAALILYFCRVIAWRDPILRNLAKNFNVNFPEVYEWNFFFLLATSIHAPHTHAHTQFLCQFIGWQNSGQLVAPINEHKKLLGADIPINFWWNYGQMYLVSISDSLLSSTFINQCSAP